MSEYLALRDGARRFRQDSSGPVLLRMPAPEARLTPTGLSPAPALLSRQLRLRPAPGHPPGVPAGPTTPTRPKPRRFGLLPVRSPLLGESQGDRERPPRLISFPPGTEIDRKSTRLNSSHVKIS